MYKKILILTILIGFFSFLASCSEENEISIVESNDNSSTEENPDMYLEGGWKLMFADYFDQDELDQTIWTPANYKRHGSSVLYYSNRKENVDVKDGKLVITSLKTENNELHLFEGMPYTSARLETKGKLDFTYGRIIVSAKVAGGQGTWPAIWMLPSENVYGNWPKSGEIDIMEYYGKRPNIVSVAYHTEKYNHTNTNISTIARSKTLVDPENTFYEYELIWTSESLTWKINGATVHFYRYNNRLEGLNDGYNQAWPFDQAFHLIINLGMGNAGAGGAGDINPDHLPTTFEIDYVKIYQLDYENIDLEAPSAPTYLEQSNINPNYFLWPRAIDDYGIKHYEIYVDNVLKGITPVHSFLFEDLSYQNASEIKVRAVDFMSRTSEFTLLESDDE